MKNEERKGEDREEERIRGGVEEWNRVENQTIKSQM